MQFPREAPNTLHLPRNIERTIDRHPRAKWLYEHAKALTQRKRNHDRFLADCRGVIHVGANAGQERRRYQRYGLDVLWIEAIPAVYEILLRNIAPFRRQRAINALVTDREGDERVFYLSSNSGLSSSIFRPHQHQWLWPQIAFEEQATLTTTTLGAILAATPNAAHHDALVMDTQGSELLVLKGAADYLGQFRFIFAEAADFHIYEGGATEAEITSFLSGHGFTKRSSRLQIEACGIGTCADVLYAKVGIYPLDVCWPISYIPVHRRWR